METTSFDLVVNADTPAEANRLAGTLQTYLQSQSEFLKASRKKSPSAAGATLDLGSTLSLVVNSAAFVYLARGIYEWLKANQNGTSGLTLPDGIILSKVNSSTAEKVVLEWLRRGHEKNS